jgi:hypothetical protein
MKWQCEFCKEQKGSLSVLLLFPPRSHLASRRLLCEVSRLWAKLAKAVNDWRSLAFRQNNSIFCSNSSLCWPNPRKNPLCNWFGYFLVFFKYLGQRKESWGVIRIFPHSSIQSTIKIYFYLHQNCVLNQLWESTIDRRALPWSCDGDVMTTTRMNVGATVSHSRKVLPARTLMIYTEGSRFPRIAWIERRQSLNLKFWHSVSTTTCLLKTWSFAWPQISIE